MPPCSPLQPNIRGQLPTCYRRHRLKLANPIGNSESLSANSTISPEPHCRISFRTTNTHLSGLSSLSSVNKPLRYINKKKSDKKIYRSFNIRICIRVILLFPRIHLPIATTFLTLTLTLTFTCICTPPFTPL